MYPPLAFTNRARPVTTPAHSHCSWLRLQAHPTKLADRTLPHPPPYRATAFAMNSRRRRTPSKLGRLVDPHEAALPMTDMSIQSTIRHVSQRDSTLYPARMLKKGLSLSYAVRRNACGRCPPGQEFS